MAGLKKMRVFSLPLVLLLLLFFFFCFSLQLHAARKVQMSKLPPPNRVLMSAQSSNPSFFNAFDTTFPTPGSMYPTDLHHQDSVDFNHHIHKHDTYFHYNTNINKDGTNFNYHDNSHQGFSASLDNPNNDALYPNTYPSKHDANEHFAASTSDYMPYEGKHSYPTPSAPSTSSQSLYGRKFPSSFEAPFLNKESYGKESPSSSGGQQGSYSSPSSEQASLYGSSSNEKSLYGSPSNDKSLYTSSPSDDKNLYASPSNKQSFYNYKANYPSNANNESPSMPKVSQFDEFTKSHPVSNYDTFFNPPTIHKNLVHTFPVSDHDLTYGQVQVP